MPVPGWAFGLPIRRRGIPTRGIPTANLRRRVAPARRTIENDPAAAVPPTHIETMLYTLALILIICWLLGLVSSYTLNGFIHILLVVAIILVLVRLIRGQKL